MSAVFALQQERSFLRQAIIGRSAKRKRDVDSLIVNELPLVRLNAQAAFDNTDTIVDDKWISFAARESIDNWFDIPLDLQRAALQFLVAKLPITFPVSALVFDDVFRQFLERHELLAAQHDIARLRARFNWSSLLPMWRLLAHDSQGGLVLAARRTVSAIHAFASSTTRRDVDDMDDDDDNDNDNNDTNTVGNVFGSSSAVGRRSNASATTSFSSEKSFLLRAKTQQQRTSVVTNDDVFDALEDYLIISHSHKKIRALVDVSFELPSWNAISQKVVSNDELLANANDANLADGVLVATRIKARALSALRSSKSAVSFTAAEDLNQLLAASTVMELRGLSVSDELCALLSINSVRERAIAQRYRGTSGLELARYCQYQTRLRCNDARRSVGRHRIDPHCTAIHFVPILLPHTRPGLGDCIYLDSCRRMFTNCCKMHYRLEDEQNARDRAATTTTTTSDATTTTKQRSAAAADESVVRSETPSMAAVNSGSVAAREAQWITCDIREFPFEMLGEFGVVMADPPWDINMDLPYGTMSDNEMRRLPIRHLQRDGLLFLWVTGRAMELGRECLRLWGYRVVEEMVWIKTNQLQRLMRTGRTGHWLNHSKEHCIVGVKGQPSLNAMLDVDVIVAPARETSRKPDEIYGLIERISPNTRKIELFGRPHNVWPGWITVGNQLGDTRIVEEPLRTRLIDAGVLARDGKSIISEAENKALEQDTDDTTNNNRNNNNANREENNENKEQL